MKKMKKYLPALIVLLLVLVFLAGCGGKSSTSESTSGSVSVENGQSVPEGMTTASQEGSESLNSMMGTTGSQTTDCSFTLEGKEYTLPVDYSVLEADGWTTDTDMNQELKGISYTWIYMTKAGEDDAKLTFDIYNGSGDSKKLKDCQIAAVEVTKKDMEHVSFALSNGIKPGDDQATVTGIMGEATNISDSDDYTSAAYGESRDSGQITFTWWKDTKKSEQDSISLECFTRQETVSSGAMPDYLSEYSAPSSMGEDFDSATLTLDQVIYRLPCPVSEFTKNGWTLDNPQAVAAGRTGYCYLKKADIQLSVTVTNYADYQTDAANCAVSKVTINRYSDTDPDPDVLFPKGITINSSLTDLETALNASSAQFEKYEGDDGSYISYSYSDYDTGTGAYFYYDTETKRITGMYVNGEHWPDLN